MNYYVYKLTFVTGTHFGAGSLDTVKIAFGADTLFSALCIEAGKKGEDVRQRLIDAVDNNKILFSDALPYIRNTNYIPKPITGIRRENTTDDREAAKQINNMDYIRQELLSDYMEGEYPREYMKDLESDSFGGTSVRVNVSIRGETDPLPYRVKVFDYKDGCGLYFILATDSEEDKAFFDELLDGVSYSGLGGKRASGLGKFVFLADEADEQLRKSLTGEYNSYMLLSGGLPSDENMDSVLEGATYLLSRRRGFIQSDDYSQQQMRKRDIYLLSAGSCVSGRFEGILADVGSQGKHPVYRYAKPLFMGVS